MSRNIEDLFEWVTSDCVVKECIEGGISAIVDECSTLFKCPKCDRLIQKARVYQGPVHLYSPEEMRERLEARKELYMNPQTRRERAAEIMRELGEIFRRAGENARKKEQITQENRREVEPQRVDSGVQGDIPVLDWSEKNVPALETNLQEPPDSYFSGGE